MSVNANVIAARRLLEEGFGNGDLSVVDEYVADDFIEHQNGAQGIGPDAVKQIITGLHQSLTDMTFSIEAIVAGEDTVWVRARVSAKNTLPFMGRPATGRDDRDRRDRRDPVLGRQGGRALGRGRPPRPARAAGACP